MVWRQPFPGPGLAIRVLGEVTEERLEMLRGADWIVMDEIKAAGLYREIWQSFAVLTPLRTVGVMGDFRTYGNMVALRMVTSDDGMTADWARVPYDVLARISNRIVNEVPGVNRVTLDITSKPPGHHRVGVDFTRNVSDDWASRWLAHVVGAAWSDERPVIPRYSNPEMARIWADEQKYEYWRRVEVAVCEAWSELGVVPEDALPAIRAATFDLKRIDEIFAETRHDVIAFVRSMAETAGPAGRYIHFGLTSNDVWDTATSLQLVAATDLLHRRRRQAGEGRQQGGRRAPADALYRPLARHPRRADDVRPQADGLGGDAAPEPRAPGGRAPRDRRRADLGGGRDARERAGPRRGDRLRAARARGRAVVHPDPASGTATRRTSRRWRWSRRRWR